MRVSRDDARSSGTESIAKRDIEMRPKPAKPCTKLAKVKINNSAGRYSVASVEFSVSSYEIIIEIRL